MPKSRRNRVVPLTVVKKKDKAWKEGKIEEIRSMVDKYKNVFYFSVHNIRTDKMQKIREDWKGSKFYMGKNKVVKVAFGKNPASEYKDGLSKLGDKLQGHRGLLFTDCSRAEVAKYFHNYSSPEFARTGSIAKQTITLDAGPLEQFNFSMEKRLRELGLDVTLKKGVVELARDFTVCEAGKPLTTESARLLELLNIQNEEFKIKVEGMWSEDQGFLDFAQEGKEKAINAAKKKKVKKPETKVAKKKKLVVATPSRRSTRNKKVSEVEEEQDVVMVDEEDEPELLLN